MITRMVVGLCIAFTAFTFGFSDTIEPVSVPDQPVLTVNKNVGTGEVVLSWTTTSNPYSVSRDADPNPNDFTPTTLASGVAGTSFSDPVLTNGINYFYLLDDANAPTRIYGRTANAAVPGTSVTLSGVGFAPILADNIVVVGGVQAIVTGATDTTLTFTVPDQAATSEVIVATPKGANLGGELYDIGTDLQSATATISSVAVDSAGTKFISTIGTDVSLADRVFTFRAVSTTLRQPDFAFTVAAPRCECARSIDARG